jgi:uncharacterized protein (TIGR02466 family)
MSNNITVLPLFATLLGVIKLNVNNKKILEFLKNLNYKENTFINETKRTSFMSKDNKIFKDKNLLELKNKSIDAINLYLKNVLYLNTKFKIINSWATKTFQKGSSHTHNHAHSFLSCCYYPKYSKSFNIKFFKSKSIDTFWNLKPEKFDINNSNFWEINPEENDLLIFPSYLEHSISFNNSEETRYSIAFCVNPIGKFNIGEDSELDIK